MIKNTASQKIGAQMITAADGTIFTGAVTVYVTGDAGTQALGSVGSGVCTSEGNGYYTYAPAQAETNYSLVAFTFIGTGAISTTVQVFTQIVQQTGDSFARIGVAGAGLTNIDLPNQTMDITGDLSGSVGSVTADVTTDSASRTASQADVSDIPTNSEFNARSLPSADYTIVSDLGTVQTADHTSAIADIPTVAEFNARSIVSADYTIVSDLGTVQTADHTAAIADIPTVAEFEARTIVSAGYVVVGDTIAGVTTVTNLTNAATNGDLTAAMKASVNAEVDTALNTAIPGSPTAKSINDYIVLSKYAVCNRWDITEASGDLDVYDDNNTLYNATAAAFTTLAGVTLRKKIL